MFRKKRINNNLTLVGFSETQAKVIKSICWLSNSRPNTYQIAKNVEQGQIILLNADSSDVHLLWSQIKNSSEILSKAIIWIGNDKSLLVTKKHFITLPLVATKVFEELDLITQRYSSENLSIERKVGENPLFSTLINSDSDTRSSA